MYRYHTLKDFAFTQYGLDIYEDLAGGKTKQTIQEYYSKMKVYTSYCSRLGEATVSLDERIIGGFVKHHKPECNWLNRFISALKFVMTLNNVTITPSFEKFCRSLKNQHPRDNEASPLTEYFLPHEVSLILHHVFQLSKRLEKPASCYRTIIIIIMSYYCLLRCSDTWELKGRNVKFFKKGAVVKSNRRKNDRLGVHPLTGVLSKRSDRLCPVTLLKFVLVKLDVKKDEYLFYNKDTKKRLALNTLYPMMSTVMKQIGLSRRCWSTNLRASAVTQLDLKGVSVNEIKQVGVWRSVDSVYHYFKDDFDRGIARNELL